MCHILYCIEHEHTVMAELNPIMMHEFPYYNEFGFLDYDWCEFTGGWATVEPEFNQDWIETEILPSEDELEMMDKDTEEFLWSMQQYSH